MLVALAPALLAEALSSARSVRDEEYRARALAALAPHLPEAERDEALAVTRGLEYEGYRARPLAALAPQLPEAERDEVLAEALAAARGIGESGFRAEALAVLAPHLAEIPTSTLYSVWHKGLPFVAEEGRPAQLIEVVALTPVLYRLGRETAMVESFHAIQDVSRWWP